MQRNLNLIQVILIIFWIPCSIASASNFKSLEETYFRDHDRIKDIVEIEYILHRCAAVYSALEVVFASDGLFNSDERSKRSAKIGDQMQKMAEPYIAASIRIAEKTNRSEKNVLDRIRLLTKEYLEIYDRNKNLTNSGVSGIVAADGETCKDVSKLVRAK